MVTAILADVASRGDTAVAELSAKFDNWSPERFRLSEGEIASCVRTLTSGQLDDIKFAQAQVRNFAQAQRESIRDVEIETLPGVVLGHRNMRTRRIRPRRRCRSSSTPTCAACTFRVRAR